jgi:ADP-heptose:LPS heptosyltransferase
VTPRAILVIMLRRIGDVLLTTPAVRALRKLYPEARIDFLADPPAHELLEGMAEVSNVLVREGSGPANYVYWLWRMRRGGYDWAIDYMGTPRTAMLTFATGAALRAGPAQVSHRWAYTHLLRESPAACYSALEKIRVLSSLGLFPDESDFLPRLPGGRKPPPRLLVGFAPASRRETRRWPAERFAELGRLLRDRLGVDLMVLWGPGEKALAEEVCRGIGGAARVAPETRDLRQLSDLISGLSLLVANCNGPKHIAVARGVPTLTIHASSDPACWTPPGHRFIRREDLPCIGCRLNRCPRGLECLGGLGAEKVFAAAQEMLR